MIRKVTKLLAALVAAVALPASFPAHPAAPATLLVFGDSLSSAYGIAPQSGWVALLAERLRTQGRQVNVVNASITGETTSGGATRIEADLARHRPSLVLLELGANDGLRGLPVAQTRANLAAMIVAIRKANAAPILIGIRVPPNYGAGYAREFQATYTDLAREYRIPLVPFLLDGIAEHREQFQADGLHPIAEAQGHILDNVWMKVDAALKKQHL